MRDIFAEEVVRNEKYKSEKVKYNIMTFLGVICLLLFFVWIINFIVNFVALLGDNFIINLILNILPGAALLGAFILFFKFRNKFCIEYDYTLVDDSLRIDQVVKSVKRFKMIDVSTKDITRIGKFGSDTYNSLVENSVFDINLYSPNESPLDDKDFFYISCYIQGAQKILVLETTEEFVSLILKNCKRGVLEADYK